MTRSHRTFAIIRPKWTIFFQIHFVEPEIVTNQQTFQSRMNFIVVEMVDSVNVTATIIDRTIQLCHNRENRNLIKGNLIVFCILFDNKNHTANI